DHLGGDQVGLATFWHSHLRPLVWHRGRRPRTPNATSLPSPRNQHVAAGGNGGVPAGRDDRGCGRLLDDGRAANGGGALPPGAVDDRRRDRLAVEYDFAAPNRCRSVGAWRDHRRPVEPADTHDANGDDLDRRLRIGVAVLPEIGGVEAPARRRLVGAAGGHVAVDLVLLADIAEVGAALEGDVLPPDALPDEMVAPA